MENIEHIKEPNYQEFKPNDKLKYFVECIWYMHGKNSSTNSDVECLVPGGRTEFIFTQSEILWHGSNFKNKPEKISSSFLLGQRDCVNYITCLDNYSSVGVRLKCGCLPVFNNIPVNNCTNKILLLSKLFGETIHNFTTTLFETQSIQEKVELIKLWLETNITDLGKDWFELQEFLNTINASENIDNAVIKKLSDNYGWNDKKTERIFLKYIGFTPHQFIKVVRFRKSVEMIFSDYKNLTDLAHSNGFYDQSHLIREFYRYAGDKPTDFLKKPNNIARFIYGKR